MHLGPQLLPLKWSRGAALGIKNKKTLFVLWTHSLRVITCLFPSDWVSTKAQTLEKQFWQIPCSLTWVCCVYLRCIRCTRSLVDYCLGYMCLTLAGYCQGGAVNRPAQIPAILQQEGPETEQEPVCSEQFQPALGQSALSGSIQRWELVNSWFVAELSLWHRHQGRSLMAEGDQSCFMCSALGADSNFVPPGITKQSYILEA